MLKRVSRWGVTALGVALAVCGVVAMAGGWDIIQVERGWSLFIGGATVLAGGAVVIALGQVVFRLDEILVAAELRRAGEKWPAPSAPAVKPQPKEAEQRSRQPPPQAPPAPTPTPTPAQTSPAQQAPLAAAPPAPPAKEPEQEAQAPAADEASGAEPQEVDRYQSGDITYVMFSDGAVEVRTSNGAQRFASLAELRAQAAQQY
jgi:outer membrane biosynthesis protein TonB